jgi:hypothetical protein
VSVTLNVSGVFDTETVGVPEIVPVDPFRLKPAGSAPLVKDHVYGFVPPVATRVVL